MPSRPNVPVPRAKGIERFGAKENEKKETTTSSRHKRKQALVGFDLDLVQGEMTMNSALKESSFSSSSSKGREESKVEKNDDDTRERASSFSSSSFSSSKALSRTTTTWKSRRVGRLSPPSPPYKEREREREREKEDGRQQQNTTVKGVFWSFFRPKKSYLFRSRFVIQKNKTLGLFRVSFCVCVCGPDHPFFKGDQN